MPVYFGDDEESTAYNPDAVHLRFGAGFDAYYDDCEAADTWTSAREIATVCPPYAARMIAGPRAEAPPLLPREVEIALRWPPHHLLFFVQQRHRCSAEGLAENSLVLLPRAYEEGVLLPVPVGDVYLALQIQSGLYEPPLVEAPSELSAVKARAPWRDVEWMMTWCDCYGTRVHDAWLSRSPESEPSPATARERQHAISNYRQVAPPVRIELRACWDDPEAPESDQTLFPLAEVIRAARMADSAWSSPTGGGRLPGSFESSV